MHIPVRAPGTIVYCEIGGHRAAGIRGVQLPARKTEDAYSCTATYVSDESQTIA